MHTKYHSSHDIGVPQSALLRKRMVQGGLLRVSTKEPGTRTILLPTEETRRHSLMTPDFVVFRKKKPALLGARKHLSEINPSFIKEEEIGNGNDHEQLGSTKTEIEKGQDPNFLPKKRHFRETEEWKKKKKRIIAKIRTMGRLNLALIMARMPTIEKLPDRVLKHIFSYLPSQQLLRVGKVCKKWKKVANSPVLWRSVSFRASHGGLQVTNLDRLLNLMSDQFSELTNCELATDLITPNLLHELSNKCPKLTDLTLDFSTAMQLHDFTDLQTFPSRLRSLTLCLSENIFLEGFLRKVYTFISSVEILHVIGTYEKVEDEEEEVYETVNFHKLKQFLPNLRVVNLWGVPFVTDEHVDSLSSNCARLECLCVNYCTKVTGSCLKLVLQRCKHLKSLLLAHARLDDKIIQTIEWEKTKIEELDIRGTELSTESIIYILTRLNHCRWLDASWLENFSDAVIDAWMQAGTINSIQYLNLDTCDSLTENALTELVLRHGNQLYGLNLGGHHKLLEYFWMNMISKLKNVRVLVMGIAEDCCPKVTAKIHIDQFVDCIAQNCPRLTRVEIRWDDETLRFSDKSSKFIDVLRMKCLKLHSVVLSEGQYYELVRSNFERADRMSVVRTTEMCRTDVIKYTLKSAKLNAEEITSNKKYFKPVLPPFLVT